MEIKNKVIVITGASEGIGLATAKELSAKGAMVVLAARSADKLAEISKELPNSFAVPTDMRKANDINHLVQQTVQKYGRLDILINNAGQGMYVPVAKIDIEEYKEVMELNVFGVLRAMQAVIPQMHTQGGGMIINVSSMVSKNFFPGLGAYASTKYALNAISLTARAELAKDHIIVSVMHPRMTATKFGENSVGQRPEWITNRPAGMPIPEIDPPEKVAAAIAELIESEDAEAMMQ